MSISTSESLGKVLDDLETFCKFLSTFSLGKDVVDDVELPAAERWILKHDYGSSQKILLVGEGDFSFSSGLATALGSATNEFLEKNYGKAISNFNNLETRGCIVIHEVDATKMADHPRLKYLKFDRIIFNFPLAGFFPEESCETKILLNQVLVARFMKNAEKMLGEKGEIHITHKCNGFFRHWKLGELASSFTGLMLLEELSFNINDYPGYHTKYGFGGDRNFDCNPSSTYTFVLNKH